MNKPISNRSPGTGLVYKIRHRKTGLFSLGGSNPTWDKRGRYYTSLGVLKNHLRQVSAAGNMAEYTDTEIVTVRITEKVVGVVTHPSTLTA